MNRLFRTLLVATCVVLLLLLLCGLPMQARDQSKANEFKELTVTASKVKFYHKGDTLVFNADAFVLPEGSMLDGLVARLPGVELHSDGRIFCNGRYVNELLLNGRDLFNGDKKLMLENLASYTVKDVAVYDKLGRNSELFERRRLATRKSDKSRLKVSGCRVELYLEG